MKLDLRELFAAGQGQTAEKAFSFELDLSYVRLWGQNPFVKPCGIDGRAYLRAGIVCVTYTAVYTIATSCARCAETLECEQTATFEHVVEERGDGEDNGEFALAIEGRLDMLALAAGDILPQLDAAFLCAQDCAGLCECCGANLNNGPCGCDTKRVDPRFEAIRKLMEDQTEN